MKSQIIKFVALMVLLMGGFSISAQNSKTSSAFAIDRNITSFAVDGLVDKKIYAHQVDPNETITTIALIMAEGTDVTALSPVITLASGASITPRTFGAQDFSQQITYTVTAQDGSTATYLFLAYVQNITRTPINVLVYHGSGGSTNPGPGLYGWDSSLQFCCIATPDPSYMFDTWLVYGTPVSSNPTFCEYSMFDLVLTATFKLIPPSISGSAAICSGSSYTFSVTNAPTGFTWGKSSNVSLSSTTMSSTSVSASGKGIGWVSINHGGIELSRKTFWISTPEISISGPSSVPLNGYTTLYANQADNNVNMGITGYEWIISPSYPSTLTSYGHYATVSFSGNIETVTVLCRATNSCGTGAWAPLNISVGSKSPSPAYPNPVNDILTVDVGSAANTNTQNLTYDVRLYNTTGNMLRQAGNRGDGTVQIDVSNLPNGIYFLHIYDGISKSPEIQQVIVKH
jgi:hypothetical protein